MERTWRARVVGRLGHFHAVRCALKKASEYREHANECRQLARTAVGSEHKAMLEKMAQTWESLARDRVQRIEWMRRITGLDSINADQGTSP
jgi:hypothetical protein